MELAPVDSYCGICRLVVAPAAPDRKKVHTKWYHAHCLVDNLRRQHERVKERRTWWPVRFRS